MSVRLGKRKQDILDMVTMFGELSIEDIIELDGRQGRSRAAQRVRQLVREHGLLEYVRDDNGAPTAVRLAEPRTARCPKCNKELTSGAQ